MAAFGKRKSYKKNDIVKESAFPPGNADKMVTGKFLVEIDAAGNEISPKLISAAIQAEKDRVINVDMRGEKPVEALVNQSLQDEDKDDGVTIVQDPIKTLALEGEKLEEKEPSTTELISKEAPVDSNDATKKIDITVEQIIEDLKDAKIPFDKNSTKEELYNLWLSID